MLNNQKAKFSLPEEITYLNGAYMSPQLKSVEEIGLAAVRSKAHPHLIRAEDFFKGPKLLRESFAKFIDVEDANQIAIISSASYGLANAANNVKLKEGDEIILLESQFPSNVYAWQKVAAKHKANIIIISSPEPVAGRAEQWNKQILNAINQKTAVIALPPAHWADGTLFDLIAIRKKTRIYDALMIIDGSQTIGALPFSVKEIQPDALITVGYKWLLGAYGLGLAYYSDYFNDGEPIENNWINRYESEDFSQLVNYNPDYQPKAGRYNMGESSHFNLVPILTESIRQLSDWEPKNIQEYCHTISKDALDQLRSLGCFIEEDAYRAKHIFGVYLPEHISMKAVKSKFSEENIFVSYRGNAIRVSPSVYNTKEDFEKLVTSIQSVMQEQSALSK